MISELTTALEVNHIIELGRAVIKCPVEILRKRVINAITHKDSKVYVDRDHSDVIRGFIFGTIEELDGDECVFIHLCVVKPLEEKHKERNLTLELVAKIEAWARERGIKTMYFMTRRNPEAFERKYKFHLEYYLMKREVKP